MAAHIKSCFIFLVLVVFATAAAAQTRNDDVTAHAELKRIADYLAAANLYSGTMMLTVDGHSFEPVVVKRQDDKAAPVDVSTPFNMGSVGKLLTLAVILNKVEEGQLALDGTIAEYWPNSGMENAEQITIAQLLSHTSGYGNYFGAGNYSLEQRTIDDFLQLIRSEGVEFAPEQGFSYSNSAFWILMRIAEKVDPQQRSWLELFDAYVATPLDINLHRFQPDQDYNSRPAALAVSPFGDVSPISAEKNDARPGPDGGFYITIGDLARFHAGLLDGDIVSPQMLQQSTRKRSHFESLGCDIGLVWELCSYDNVEYRSKGGTTAGSGAGIFDWQIDGHQYRLVMLSNLYNAPLFVFPGIARELTNDRDFVAPETNEHPLAWLWQKVTADEVSQVTREPDLWYQQRGQFIGDLQFIVFAMSAAREGYQEAAEQLLQMHIIRHPEQGFAQRVLKRIQQG
ncbi:serine hydrolase domain-containing protein [Pseudidiomarina insulisalsae]|uniref:Beta-lactamase-related domain-containing protein n=1 Tax=Pseudidiomarina insulisalsae TaxID=575789 RepID=A0A432YQL6_9GAMM|nr:serine hydrolase domain-containing protein [Pseudidiomarina insulisalsae]RUO63640.1 hypothetical protein CWI71_00825 [Pseudidiomarina insulisalsae]